MSLIIISKKAKNLRDELARILDLPKGYVVEYALNHIYMEMLAEMSQFNIAPDTLKKIKEYEALLEEGIDVLNG